MTDGEELKEVAKIEVYKARKQLLDGRSVGFKTEPT